ncbi:MAG: SgcJ/EcaC family oxidoreductase [Acidobacteriota bacterium]|jgi:uncharacterized protein (TIGR02246 family)
MRKGMIVLAVLALASGMTGLVVAQETTDEEAALKAVGSQWADAWNAGDMTAVGALYAEDADYVNFFGQSFKGREQIEASFAEVHEGVYKGSKISIETTAVRLVKPDVAISDSAWEMTGLPEVEGPAMPSKGLSTAVMVKQDGEWKIAAHRTRVAAAPAE